MRKNFTATASLIIVSLLLAACAAPSAMSTPAVNSATPTPQVTHGVVQPTSTRLPDINVDAAMLKGLQIQFMHPWSGENAKEMAALIDQFNQTNEWGIHVIAQVPGSAGMLVTTLTDDLATGNQPAMAAAPVDVLLRLNRNGSAIADLNPYIYSQTWGMTPEVLGDLDPVFMAQDAVQGFQYGIPAERTAVMMFYNVTWARELGFSSSPSLPEEFQSQSCAANQTMKKDTDTTNDGLGGWIVNTDGLVTYSWLINFNAQVFENGQPSFNTPAVQQAFKFIHDLFTSGCAWIPRAQTPYDYFANRQTLIYSGYLQDILPQQFAMTVAGSKDEWKPIPFPSDQAQRELVQGPSYAVLKTTPEKQLASWLFIRWLTDPARQASMVQTSMTLPLSGQVKTQLMNSSATPQQWKDAVNAVSAPVPVPSDPNWSIARTVLEDAGWQTFKTNLADKDIPTLLDQINTTITELEGQNP